MKETMIETEVTYTLEHGGKFSIHRARAGAGVPGDRGAVLCPGDRGAHSGGDQGGQEAYEGHSVYEYP